mgnify:CR=1 FL=1
MGEIATGKIIGVAVEGAIDIRVPYDNWERFCKREYDEVLVEFPDMRPASNEQKAKAHILMKAISNFSGEDKEKTEFLLKNLFLDKFLTSLNKKYFSLATCDMTTAKDFISMLVDFCIEFGVPLAKPLYELCEDIERYMYQCLMHKTCLICGKHADLHHCEGSTVGMGGDRTTMIHEGLEVMPLCRDHHNECHQHGQKVFNEKYHFQNGYILTAEICKHYGLRYNLT